MAVIDLESLGGELLKRAGESVHAQEPLYKHIRLTAALFAFRDGGSLPEHRVRGAVSIQVISGMILLHAASQSQSAPAHHFVRLAPDVPHSVECNEDSVILVHVGALS